MHGILLRELKIVCTCCFWPSKSKFKKIFKCYFTRNVPFILKIFKFSTSSFSIFSFLAIADFIEEVD